MSIPQATIRYLNIIGANHDSKGKQWCARLEPDGVEMVSPLTVYYNHAHMQNVMFLISQDSSSSDELSSSESYQSYSDPLSS